MLRMRSSSPTATVTETAHCSTLLDFLSYWLHELIFITPHTLLVADTTSNKLSLVDMNSVLLTCNSLCVEQSGKKHSMDVVSAV